MNYTIKFLHNKNIIKLIEKIVIYIFKVDLLWV